MHGGAPRVRHRVNNGEEPKTQIVIDRDKVLSIATEAVVTTAVSVVVAKYVLGQNEG